MEQIKNSSVRQCCLFVWLSVSNLLFIRYNKTIKSSKFSFLSKFYTQQVEHPAEPTATMTQPLTRGRKWINGYISSMKWMIKPLFVWLSTCLMAVFQSKSLCTRVTKVVKIATLLSIYSYIRQVQYFLPLPSSVGCPLCSTKELDTLNWRLWWITFEVRSLYRCTGFIPGQSSFQVWIERLKHEEYSLKAVVGKMVLVTGCFFFFCLFFFFFFTLKMFTFVFTTMISLCVYHIFHFIVLLQKEADLINVLLQQ